ncbi:MAG: hypothetical protein Q8922_09450 [Bacteroidota bacterium]|nr:hypothetical protein [Bacteroidota bacterium]MDP4234417.1 hypothetical protein [Bacteroidota bacterium]MDP4243983.1 hypothetical protein [Bacteroidota bacterium]MDP4288149.1 hypothetical protein [Bacteroidota bacterium]
MDLLFPHLAPIWHSTPIVGTYAEPKFEFSGIPLNFSHAKHFIARATEPVLAGEITHTGEPLVHIFDSHDMFEEWAATTRFAKHFEHIQRVIERVRFQAHLMHKTVPPRRTGRIQVASNVSMDFDWVAGTSIRPIQKDSRVRLYSEESFAGEQTVIGSSALENLGDVDFFRRTRSISLHGVCLLTDDVYFGGFRFYVIGDPFVSIANLHQWHFDRAAASAIIV